MRRRSQAAVLIGCSCASASFVLRPPRQRPFAASTGDVGATTSRAARRRHRDLQRGVCRVVGASSALRTAPGDKNQESPLPTPSLPREVDEILARRRPNATDTRTGRLPPWGAGALTVAAVAAAAALVGSAGLLALSPHLTNALDHPVDHDVLGIPSPVPDGRYFVAGAISAATSHGITTPVDVIKTRMQSDDDGDLRRAGFTGVALALWRRDGPTVLLEGLGPTVLGYGVEGALKFGLYESMKPAFASWLQVASDDVSLPYLLASVTAGAAASVILCPMEQLRIRAVTDPSFRGLPDLIEEAGVVGLFRGLPAMLSKQVPYTYGKQVTYDEFAAFLYSVGERNLGLPEASIKFEVSVVAAFLASMAACLLSHPGDVVLTRTYKKSSSSSSSSGDPDPLEASAAAAAAGDRPSRDFVSSVRGVYASQGLGGFVAGLSARLVHVGVIVTSQLVLYDSVKQVLGLPATGAH